MVRLVFRPYAQVRRTICTSVSLRASTRVSPGFTQLRYRSPSFGSNQLCLSTNIKSGRCCTFHNYRFHYACKVKPLTLAQLTNSLVRVSRRVVYKRIKPYTKTLAYSLSPVNHSRRQRVLASLSTISSLLALLSKCFSTFPHGTCLLSVSG
jgi:hypothetical protein